MSKITVFDSSKAIIGDFSMDDDAIALIECDDAYDEKALSLQGCADLDKFTKKAKSWTFFCEVTAI